MIKKNMILILIGTALLSIAAFTGLGLSGCSEPTEPTPQKVTILLDWTPNTNYSGLFVAVDKGYYQAEDLEVEIVQAGGTVVQLVATGKAQFGISYQEEVTFARAGGMPVVSIAAILQHNTSGFASLREKGIRTPADFEGKRYGGWGSPIEEATVKALMERSGASFDTVDMVTTGEVDSLIVMERDADFAWIYYGWTGIEAELKGIDLNFIQLRDIEPALDYYTPVIIAGEELINQDPQLVERFMRATTKGYQLAIEDPAEAARILLAGAPELDEALVSASQDWLKDQYQAGASVWGLQREEVWESYTRWLFERGLIDEMIDIDQAFTNRFIE